MSWHYSRVLVEEYLGENCLGGDVFVLLNLNHFVVLFCANDKMTDYSRLFRSGMMFAPLMGSHGKELLRLYLEDSHAKILAQPEKGQELKEADPDCGVKWHESFLKYDHDTHGLRTHRSLFSVAFNEFSATLPKWGMMRNGELYQRKTPGLFTREVGFGFLHTPTKSDWKHSGRVDAAERYIKSDHQLKVTVWIQSFGYRSPHPEPLEEMMFWPLGWTDLKPLGTGKCLKQWP